MTVGSSSAIFACGAARLGLRVAFVGVVGDDAVRPVHARGDGRPRDRRLGLHRGPGPPDRRDRGPDERPDRAILTAMGTIGALDVDAVPDAMLDRARHLHSSCFFLQDTSRDRLPAFMAAARARGLTTSFDTNWDPTGRWDGGVTRDARACDVFLPNEAEARRIARRRRGGRGPGAGPDRRPTTDRPAAARSSRSSSASKGALAGRTGRAPRARPGVRRRPGRHDRRGRLVRCRVPARLARRRLDRRRAAPRRGVRRALDPRTRRRRRPAHACRGDRRPLAALGTPHEGARSGSSSSRRTRRSTGSRRWTPDGRGHPPAGPRARRAGRQGPERGARGRRLGARVTVAAIVAGRAGEWIAERLVETGIDAALVRDGGLAETRTCLSVLDRSTGRLTEFYEPGTADPAGRRGPAFEDASRAELGEGDVAAVVCSGSLPPGAPEDAYARIVRLAARAIDDRRHARRAARPGGRGAPGRRQGERRRGRRGDRPRR